MLEKRFVGLILKLKDYGRLFMRPYNKTKVKKGFYSVTSLGTWT